MSAANDCSLDALVSRRFRCIVADPPWRYDCDSPPCPPENSPETMLPEYYYPTMPLGDIKALPVAKVADKDSVLFVWAVCPMLPEAFSLMAAWGWKYKTILTWHKINSTGMGYWLRGHTEHMLVGVRGKVPAFRNQTPNIIYAERGRHSEKPEEAFALIEAVSPGPRLELFARRARPGWTVWGNEVPCNATAPRDLRGDRRVTVRADVGTLNRKDG